MDNTPVEGASGLSSTSVEIKSQSVGSSATQQQAGKPVPIQEVSNEESRNQTCASDDILDDSVSRTVKEESCESIDIIEKLASEVGSTIDREPLNVEEKLQEYRKHGELQVDLEEIDD